MMTLSNSPLFLILLFVVFIPMTMFFFYKIEKLYMSGKQTWWAYIGFAVCGSGLITSFVLTLWNLTPQ